MAHGAELVADGGTEEQPVRDENQAHCEQEPDLQPIRATEQSGELRGIGYGFGDRVIGSGLLEDGRLQQIVDHEQGDEVEHDRRDDLVGAGLGLEQAGDCSVQGAADDPAEDGERDVNGRRRRHMNADQQRHHAARMNLAVGADVEEPGAKADGDRETGHDQRRCCEERL